jgi:2-iminobutanoate/2-iminopropanoate deaminase
VKVESISSKDLLFVKRGAEAFVSRRYLQENPSRPFSDSVLIDDKTLFLSGRLGLRPDTYEIPESIEDEVHMLMQDLRQLLSTADMTLEDLVFVQVFSPDVSLWARFNAIYRQYFSRSMPPRSFIGSGALLFGANFELQGIAVRDCKHCDSLKVGIDKGSETRSTFLETADPAPHEISEGTHVEI